MHVLRWCFSAILGFIAGFIFLDVLAALLYALPRAVINGIRRIVRWKVAGVYFAGALAYTAALVLSVFVAQWFSADWWWLL